MKRYMPFVLVALLAVVAAQAGATNLLANGSFQDGNFANWLRGTTDNGTPGDGFPVIAQWPLNNAINAWEGEVGEINFTGLQAGATLEQTFFSSGGAGTLSLDWAVSSPFESNADGGEFTMILNGVIVAQYDSGAIDQGALLNGTLSTDVNLVNGVNLIEIDITRAYTSTPGQTPFQYMTNIDAEGQVPEPGSLILMGSGVLGLGGILRRKIGC